MTVRRGNAPLIVSLPHTGADIPDDIEATLVSSWRARVDCDWWIDRLYAFAEELDATLLRTAMSRTVIDVNRDPSGASLYPGQATTGLCPTETFDGDPLYRDGCEPDADEIARRLARWAEPYHESLRNELARLRAAHARVVLYDAHSIRSRIPRLFEGILPHANIGTNDASSCDQALTRAVAAAGARHSAFSSVVNGRFKGGYITRQYGKPARGVHAIQMELACRGYMAEPDGSPTEADWPSAYDPVAARPIQALLAEVLRCCIEFATHGGVGT